MSNKEYICNICNKEYKSYMGLWKHIKNNHNQKCTKFNKNLKSTKNIITLQEISETNIINKKFNCQKCNKDFTTNFSRLRHEKNCLVKKDDYVVLQEQIKNLSNEITILKSKPNIVNNYTQNNNTLNTNNTIIKYSPGNETIEHFTNDHKHFVMNKGLACLMYLIESTNFDKSKPENHSYCVTALNDKHASVVNTNTNSVVKADKMELFDKVLAGNLNKIEKLSKDKAFNKTDQKNFSEIVDRLKNVLFINKKGMKKYYNDINLISYNNKELVLETWKDLKKLDDCRNNSKSDVLKFSNELSNQSDFNGLDSESDIESDDEVNTTKLNKFRQQFLCKTSPIFNDNSDNDSNKNSNKNSDINSHIDSDSDSDSIDEITIRGVQYLIENNYVYYKNKNGTKGKIYGTYNPINYKVKKYKEKEIDI